MAFPLASVRSPIRVGEEAVTWLASGVLGLDIQMPSTWMPLWIARTPKGMSVMPRALIPQYRISASRTRRSSSINSSLAIFRFVHQSRTRPKAKTNTMQHARTYMQGLEASRRRTPTWTRDRRVQRLLLEGQGLTNVISSHNSHPMKKTAISTKISATLNSQQQPASSGRCGSSKEAGISRLP